MEARDPVEIANWAKYFAVEANGLGWTLTENPSRSPEQGDQMLSAAHAAAYHWNAIGTDVHKARADMLLAQAYAVLGHGTLAMRYAQRMFDFITGRDSPDWEVPFAHAVLANAAHAAGVYPLHAKHYEIAKDLADKLPDPEDKEIFDAAFNVIPVPQRL